MLGVPSFPAANSPQRLGDSNNDRRGSRTKVALKPGRSLMDWIRLANGGKDIQGFSGRNFSITTEELAKHNKVDDCWMAIRGRVFNVTQYMEYHPGGIDELMRGAGKDATDLFNEVHKWVNFNSMLAKCYIGPLKDEPLENRIMKKPDPKLQKTSDGFLIPAKMPSVKTTEVIPRYDWYEKDGEIILSIYTKTKIIDSSDVIIDCMDGKTLNVKIFLAEKYYQLLVDLEHAVDDVSVSAINSTKVDVLLVKKDASLKWTKIGSGLLGHNVLQLDSNRDINFRNCVIEGVTEVTHDTKLYSIALPNNVYYETPIGRHVIIKANVEGIEMRRNYTVALSSLDHEKSAESSRGRVLNVLIKCYPQGVLTPHINALKIGDSISLSDCIGTFKRSRLKEANTILLIAAGTGFTPMVRLINYYLIEEQSTNCHVKLLFANKTEDDIIWKDQIDALVKKYPQKFHVTYILSKPHDTWKGLTGRIDESTLKSFISEDPFTKSSSTNQTPSIQSEDSLKKGLDKLYTICGPDQFTTSVNDFLVKFGIREESIHCFLA